MRDNQGHKMSESHAKLAELLKPLNKFSADEIIKLSDRIESVGLSWEIVWCDDCPQAYLPVLKIKFKDYEPRSHT